MSFIDIDVERNKLSFTKFLINILKTKIIKLLKLWTLWLKKGKGRKWRHKKLSLQIQSSPYFKIRSRAAKRRSGLAKPEKPAELEKFIWLKLQEYKPADLAKLGQGAEEFSRIR